jgi:hypothetical protein
MGERTSAGAKPDRTRLEGFFVRYGEAVSDGDPEATSACYAVPSIAISDEGAIPIATGEEVEAAFDGSAERYGARGMVAVRPTVVAAEALTEKLVSADVRWDHVDEGAQRRAKRLPLRAQAGGRGAADLRAHRDPSR